MPDAEEAILEARDLMRSFAERTGVMPGRTPRRYLWTDAFAVCNLLGLWRATGEERDLDLALALVGQVHEVLGRHRSDDGRRGWLSGLADDLARAHPTAGGLRIGLVLGLDAARRAVASATGRVRPSTTHRLEHVARYAPFAEALLDFWRTPAHRATQTWLAHEDIDDVMLATCLAPAGYLDVLAAD